jgi:hypothetical protein
MVQEKLFMNIKIVNSAYTAAVKNGRFLAVRNLQ